MQLDHGEERGVLGPRGALRFEPRVIGAGEPLAQCARQARLADPGFAADRDHPAATATDLPPCLEQPVELLIAADEGCQVVRAEQVEPAANAGRARHAVRRHRAREPLQELRPQVLELEQAPHEPFGVAADDDGVPFGDPLETGGDVQRLAQREDLAALLATGPAQHDGAGVDADAKRQPLVHIVLWLFDDREAGPNGALGRVLVRLRVAEVGEHSVAQVLGHVTAVACDDLGRARMVGLHQFEVVLGVEPRRELHRADEVAEERCELAPLPGHVLRLCHHVSLESGLRPTLDDRDPVAARGRRQPVIEALAEQDGRQRVLHQVRSQTAHRGPAPRDVAPAKRLAAKLLQVRERRGGQVIARDRLEPESGRPPEPPVELLQVRQDEHRFDQPRRSPRGLTEGLEPRPPPRLDGDEATTRTQHAMGLFDDLVDVRRVADGLDREHQVEGPVGIRQAVEVAFVNLEVAATPGDQAGCADVPRREIDADEVHLGVPPGEAEQVEAPSTADLEHPARAPQVNVPLDHQRLRPVAAAVEAAVGVQRHVHRAAHRVRKEIEGRALREVGDDRVETAPLRKQPGKVEVPIELREALRDVGFGARPAQLNSNVEVPDRLAERACRQAWSGPTPIAAASSRLIACSPRFVRTVSGPLNGAATSSSTDWPGTSSSLAR